MPLYTIPASLVIEAPTPAAAQAQAQKAQQLLNESFTKQMIAGQGVNLKSAKVGVPTPGAT